MVLSLYASCLYLNSVAAVANSISSRIRNGRSIADLAGLGPFFFSFFPQFTGGTGVLDSNDYSVYHAMQSTTR
jgi:hypothetical protein